MYEMSLGAVPAAAKAAECGEGDCWGFSPLRGLPPAQSQFNSLRLSLLVSGRSHAPGEEC